MNLSTEMAGPKPVQVEVKVGIEQDIRSFDGKVLKRCDIHAQAGSRKAPSVEAWSTPRAIDHGDIDDPGLMAVKI